MAWITTKSGKRVNTEWFEKEAQIARNQKEAEERSSKAPKTESSTFHGTEISVPVAKSVEEAVKLAKTTPFQRIQNTDWEDKKGKFGPTQMLHYDEEAIVIQRGSDRSHVSASVEHRVLKNGREIWAVESSWDAMESTGLSYTQGRSHTTSGWICKSQEEARKIARQAAAYEAREKK